MTNWHCIQHPRLVEGLDAYFNYSLGVPVEQRMKVQCNKFLAHQHDLDYALIECAPLHPILENYVTIDARPYPVINGYDGKNRNEKLDRDLEMYIIHQQCVGENCLAFKKFQIERIRETGAKDAKHKADTIYGSSGSPIFDLKTNRLIALHHEGNPSLNQAIAMYKIVNELKYLAKKDPIYKRILSIIKFIE